MIKHTANLAPEMQMVYRFRTMTTRRLPTPPAEVVAQLSKIAPPAKVPRGYFDPLVAVTKNLLDNKFKLSQAADELIKRKLLPKKHRKKFHEAMRGRLSRLRQANAKEMTDLKWRTSMFYDAVHAVGMVNGELISLCGVKASHWQVWDECGGIKQCGRCQSVAKRTNACFS